MSDPIGPGEAARRLGVSTRTVQRWLREGRLPGVRVGSRLKVDGRAVPVAGDAESAPVRRIDRLLVANRGELVVRIARTCRRLGIRCQGLVAEDQARAWWTGAVDEIVPLRGGYLETGAIVTAARAAGSDAIHPGYGFLAENADFAQAVLDAGMAWVGPPPAAMRSLGDKAAARGLARSIGVPVVEGYDGAGQTDWAMRRAADRIGFPLLVKPSAGGGGKGMHVARSAADLPSALGQARREARTAFGDERLILERYLERPRHVEVQLLIDGHGTAVHLGERDCSLQRRHQKVIEEQPSPQVDERLRAALGEAALRLAAGAGYRGVGTAEFLLDQDGRHYFLELNARLQVEHPVTELVTGRDLVADQLAIAAGRPLELSQGQIEFDGHAVEARLYAEDPGADFLPAAGEVADVRWPAVKGVRVDAGIGVGDVVGTRYDPMLAKFVAHAPNRAAAIGLLRAALDQTSVLGLTTNRGFLRWLLAQPEVEAGMTHTALIDERWSATDEIPEDAWRGAVAALAEHLRAGSPAVGFRLNARPALRVEIDRVERTVEVPATPRPGLPWLPIGREAVLLDVDGRSVRARLAPAPTVEAAVRHASHEGAPSQLVSSPMPGTVLAVRVAEGDEVEAGQVLLVLEAMKMENGVPAPAPARVSRVLVEVGQSVQRGEPLVELA